MNEKTAKELNDLGWSCLVRELESPVGKSLRDFLASEVKSGKEIYPKFSETFQAFKLVPFNKVKLIIVGQDPYHTAGMATGLAFGVPDYYQRPLTLRNIFKELEREYDFPVDKGANSLEGWAEQGVLLINTCLSVERGASLSHNNKGWEVIIDNVIKALAQDTNMFKVFVLWGEKAKEKKALIGYNHAVLESAHPSPLTFGGFMGCDHFLKSNQLLAQYGKTEYNKKEVDWFNISGSGRMGEYERLATANPQKD